MGTQQYGVLLSVKRLGRLVQLVYEKGCVTKQYTTEGQAAAAFNAWAVMANGR